MASILLVVAIVAGGVWWRQTRRAEAPLAAPAVAVDTPSAAPAAPANSEYLKLAGKWLRPDGGYVLEIRGAAPEGKLEAAYLNPRPINVARAQWERKDTQLQVFVELRDVNYPGSTYNLIYHAASDQLTGIYYQAAIQQEFEVVFQRMK